MRIAFGIFDWGLGHATRDIPVIEALLAEGNEVDIFSTGRALSLLKNRFGKRCSFNDVPSVFAPYSKSRFFTLYFIMCIPKMVLSLRKARKMSKELLKKGKYDKVISDCRYDFYDSRDNSYLINHQLRFKSFFGAQAFMELWLAYHMNRYRYVLVPDFENPNISGSLSHNLRFFNHNRIKYVGILAQTKKADLKRDVDYFISISGPECQRMILEQKIMSRLKDLKGKTVISLGKPEVKESVIKKDLEIYSFLDSERQAEFMNRAKMIITRSGYTTIMELLELDKKDVLMIPTPGQTEQEYLSDLYEEKKYFHHSSQYYLDLDKDTAIAREYNGFKCPWKTQESVSRVMDIINE